MFRSRVYLRTGDVTGTITILKVEHYHYRGGIKIHASRTSPEKLNTSTMQTNAGKHTVRVKEPKNDQRKIQTRRKSEATKPKMHPEHLYGIYTLDMLV